MIPAPGAAGPRVLLVDDLDAMGADWADAHERAAWLKAAGARVTWVALVGDDDVPPHSRRETFHVLPRVPISLRRVRTLARSGRFDLVVVAAAEQGGGPVGVALAAGSRARWWPTGLSGAPAGGLSALKRALGGPGLPALDGAAALGAGLRFGWSAADLSRRPGRSLPLWDGDLALAPEGFEGRSGGRLLEAFASLADEWSGVDLVAWTDPDPEGNRRAAGLDIATRVHHVGSPRRIAEWAWWAQASLVVLRGTEPLSAGLVLRALASGCPLVWVAPEPSVAGCAHWMEQQGTAYVVGDDREAIAALLMRVLERGEEVERVVVRGRALAAAMDPRSVVERLSLCLESVPAARKRAA